MYDKTDFLGKYQRHNYRENFCYAELYLDYASLDFVVKILPVLYRFVIVYSFLNISCKISLYRVDSIYINDYNIYKEGDINGDNKS